MIFALFKGKWCMKETVIFLLSFDKGFNTKFHLILLSLKPLLLDSYASGFFLSLRMWSLQQIFERCFELLTSCAFLKVVLKQKITLNFYFHTSLRYLKRFAKIKIWLNFFSSSGIRTGRVSSLKKDIEDGSEKILKN